FVEGDDAARAKAAKALCKYEKCDAPDPARHVLRPFTAITAEDRARTIGPDADEPGSLTEPRMFNLMFETHCGAVRDEDS
ncbi:MAG: glycine--tRNA ligase, partial [Phycisphaerales bacterium]